jgi:uncharacterized protein (DUF983 family)
MSDDAERPILNPQGKPARRETSVCPRCGAPASKRVLSSGFGHPLDLCGVCGYQFGERTVEASR